MKKLYLVGIGMGNPETLTEQGRKAVSSSGLLIGAERMVNAFPNYQGKVCCAITPANIMEAIMEHSSVDTVSVIFSGDVGFYSGAKRLNQSIEEQKSAGPVNPWAEYDVELIPGISSLQYFCAKLKLSWENTNIVSLHGRATDNILGAVWNHQQTFFLTGGDCSVGKICSILAENGLGEAIVHVGERLSYPEERIETAAAKSLTERSFDTLAVMIVENERRLRPPVTHGLPDDLFQRGGVPMTKSEIRSITLSKLQLKPTDVVYDIGAGTGSVSIEMAFQVREGMVYAVECNEEAVGLIRTNADRLGAWNLKVVPGKAPEALETLPVPSCAFIGGSKGNLAGILRILVEKNPSIRVVINAITLETVTEALNQLHNLEFEEIEIIQVFVAAGKQAGNSHMMLGQNPVFIISAERN